MSDRGQTNPTVAARGRGRETLDLLDHPLLEAVAEAIVVFDPSGAIEDANPAAARVLGWPPERLIGERVERLIPDLADAGATDEGREVLARRADGSRFPAFLSISEMEVGGRRLMAAVLRDLTVEARARALEARNSAIVESAVDAMVVIDARGIVRDVNPATERMFGWSPEELVGRNVSVLMPEPVRSAHDEHLRRYLAGGEPRIIGKGREVTGRRRDGSTFPAFLSVAEMAIDGERMFTGVVSDISELRAATAETERLVDHNLALQVERRRSEQLVEKLRASNEELERFAQLASHDLREPLRSVVAFSDLLEEHLARRGSADPGARECLDEIRRGGLRLEAHLDGVLELSTLLRTPVVAQEVPVLEIFDSARMSLTARIRELEADVEVAHGGLVVEGDHKQLVRLVQNLMENALKYRRPDGPPWVGLFAASEDGAVVVSVADAGIGIEESQRERIFEPYRRLAARDGHEGLGLGLAVCRRIVDRHGGRIWAEGRPEGGSVFRFTLPRPGASPAPPATG